MTENLTKTEAMAHTKILELRNTISGLQISMVSIGTGIHQAEERIYELESKLSENTQWIIKE